MSQLLRQRGALILIAFWLLAYLIPLGWRPLVQPEELRHAELDGQTLVLSGKDEVDGVTRFHSLVWHRTEAVPEGIVIQDS